MKGKKSNRTTKNQPQKTPQESYQKPSIKKEGNLRYLILTAYA